MSRYLDSWSQLDFIASIIVNGYAQTASVFECQPTSSSDQVFTPNIPDLYFDHTNAAAFRTGAGANLTTVTGNHRKTFIYTTPPESACSGIVTAIQYCYHTRINNPRRDILRFLSLSRDGFDFKVMNVQTGRAVPQDDCSILATPRICCTTATFSANTMNQFRISSNYTFGAMLLNDLKVRPLAFSGMADVKYQFPHFVTRLTNGNPPTGFTFTHNRQNNRYLLLMRFFIGIMHT